MLAAVVGWLATRRASTEHIFRQGRRRPAGGASRNVRRNWTDGNPGSLVRLAKEREAARLAANHPRRRGDRAVDVVQAQLRSSRRLDMRQLRRWSGRPGRAADLELALLGDRRRAQLASSATSAGAVAHGPGPSATERTPARPTRRNARNGRLAGRTPGTWRWVGVEGRAADVARRGERRRMRAVRRLYAAAERPCKPKRRLSVRSAAPPTYWNLPTTPLWGASAGDAGRYSHRDGGIRLPGVSR